MDMDAGHFVDCNDLALDLFSMPREELLKTSPSKLSPTNIFGRDAEAYSRQLIQEALAGDNPSFDWIHIDKNGNEIPCEVRLIRFPPYNRNLVRGTIIHKDDNSRIARRASEGRLILTLESAKIGTFDWFPQVNQLTWDKRLYGIFELDPNSKIDLNDHFFSIIHSDDKERVGKEFEKSLMPGGPNHHRIEYRVVTDGRVKHLLAHSRMIRDDKGEVIRMLGTTQDITELRETENFLDLVLDSAGIGTFENYPTEDRSVFDHRFRSIFGIDENQTENLLETFFSRIHQEDLDLVNERYEKVLQKNGLDDVNLEYKIVVNDSIKYVLGYGKVFRNKNGEATRLVGTVQDITARRISEEKVRKNEELLDSIVQDQKEMIVRWRPGGYRTFVNRAYCETFNLEPQTAIDESFFPLLEKTFKEKFIKDIESLTPENPVRIYTIQNQLPNGEKAWQEWSDRAYFDNEGMTIEYQSVGRDITAWKESEHKQRAISERLKAISDNLPGVVLRYKLNSDFTEELVFVSDGVRDLIGVEVEDAIADINIVWSKFHQEDLETVKQSIQESYVNMTRWYAEWRVHLVNGSIGWVQGTGQPKKLEDGSVIWDSVILDITSQMLVKRQLEESEKRYRNVFNQQFQFTAVLDLDGKVIHINDLPLKVQGLKKEDYLGKYFWESPSWSGNKEWQEKIKSQVLFAKKMGETLIVEDPFYGSNRQIHWAMAAYSVIKNSGGELENILVQATDITAEKQAKQEIEERERKLSLIYENTNDFILLIRCDEEEYVLEEINESNFKLFDFFNINRSKEEVIGITMKEVYRDLLQLPGGKVKERLLTFDQIKSKRTPISYQQLIENEKGLLVTTVELVPVIQNNLVTHILMVAKDITETYLGQKRLEEAYQQVNKLKAQLEQENIYLKEEIKQANDFENMVFKSKEFRGVLKKVEQVAKTDATVLITGETGTGKELIARAIHNVSKRLEKPMIKVNTAAIPKDLIESELFGYQKGAFTGALGEKPGKFELADGGTIFLDEIGDMALDLQVKILRVLQEGEVERLGSTQTKKIDVRIISATNKDLEKAVEDGSFREDLYFRLKVFPIEIPPLRSRSDDIPILVEHFISKYGVKYGNPIKIIPKSVMDYLRNNSWPGNVRELENTIERAVILSTSGKLELPEVIDNTNAVPWEHNSSLDVVMENHIRKVLKECDWKVEGEDGAAAQLKIKPSTLRDRMRKFSIKRPR